MSNDKITLSVRLTGDGKELRGELDLSAKDFKNFGDQAEDAGKKTQSTAGAARNLWNELTSLKGVVTTLGLAYFTREVYQAGNAVIGFTNAMRAATDSQQQASKEIQFARNEAARLGLVIENVVPSYAKLTAASKGTTLAGEGTRKIFTAVSEAARVMNLSAYDTEGALNAIQQMMSKGNVQAEELRGQLGERIPGAFQIAARAMNVTTAELNDMLDRGDVLAEDLLPKLADELRRTFSAGLENSVRSPSAEMARLKNEIFNLKVAIAESGFLDFLTSAISKLTEATAAAAGLVKSLSGKDEGQNLTGVAALEASVEKMQARLFEARDNLFNKENSVGFSMFLPSEQELNSQISALETGIVASMRQINALYAAMQPVVHDTLITAEALYASPTISKGLQDYTTELNRQALAVGLSREQTILYAAAIEISKAENADNVAAVWASAQALAAQAKGFDEATESARKHSALMAEGAKIYAGTRTPGEALAGRLQNLHDIYSAGGFGAVGSSGAVDTLRRASDQADQQYVESLTKKAAQIDEVYRELARGIQQTFTGMFQDIFTNGLEGFAGFADKVKSLAIGIASNVAGAAATNAILPASLGGVGAANPMLGLGLLGGGLLLGELSESSRAADERRQRNKEAGKLSEALEFDLGSALRVLRGESTSAAEDLRRLSIEISKAYVDSANGDALDRVNAERELFDLQRKRYELEKSHLEGLIDTLDGVLGKTERAQSEVDAFISKLRGDPLLTPDNIKEKALLTSPSSLGLPGYINTRNDLLEKEKFLNTVLSLYDTNAIEPKGSNRSKPLFGGESVLPNAWEKKHQYERQLSDVQTRYADIFGPGGLFEQNFNGFIASAGDAVDALSKLKDSTIDWYEQQRAVMDALLGASSGIETTLTGIRRSQLSPVARVDDLLSEFNNVFTGSSQKTGLELAGSANQLNALANPLLTEARDVYGSGGGYQTILSSVVDALEEVQSRVNEEVVNIEQQALEALLTINTQLGSIHGTLVEVKEGLESMNSGIDTAYLDELLARTTPNITIMTQDGQTLVSGTINEIGARSANGETVIHAYGPNKSSVFSPNGGAGGGGYGGF